MGGKARRGCSRGKKLILPRMSARSSPAVRCFRGIAMKVMSYPSCSSWRKSVRKCVRQNQGRMTVSISDDYKQKIADDGEERREALRRRKMVERKFGEAKKWHGMGRARYRGRAKVKIQVLMAKNQLKRSTFSEPWKTKLDRPREKKI